MSHGSSFSSSPVQKRRGNGDTSHQNDYDLENFRSRWIEKIDKNFSEERCPSFMDEPHLSTLTESINNSDDREVAKIMSEFDRMQRSLAYFERESRKRQLLEYFSTKTCTSDQLIFIRNNQTLVTNLKDIELLPFGDSDDDSIFTDMPSTTSKISLDLSSYSRNPFITTPTTSTTTTTKSFRNSLNQSFLYRVMRLFSCW